MEFKYFKFKEEHINEFYSANSELTELFNERINDLKKPKASIAELHAFILYRDYVFKMHDIIRDNFEIDETDEM